MKKHSYKPIRRQPKRFYSHTVRKAKRRRRFFIFFLIIFILGVIFIPGHNGVIKLMAKQLRIRRLRHEIENLKIKIELVRAKVDRTNDPEFIKRYAYDRYGMVPKQDTLSK